MISNLSIVINKLYLTLLLHQFKIQSVSKKSVIQSPLKMVFKYHPPLTTNVKTTVKNI